MSSPKEKKKSLNFNTICRICLTDRGLLRNIFPSVIPMMVHQCTSIQILEDDGLPKQICRSCFRQIAKFYTFRKKVLRSNNFLRSYVKQKKATEMFADILGRAVIDAEIVKEEDGDNEISLESDCSEDNRPLSKIKKEITAHTCASKMPPLIPLKMTTQMEENELSESRLPENVPPLIVTKPLTSLNPLLFIKENVDLELKLQCSNCQEGFNTVKALKDHRMFICQPSKLECNICKKTFNEKKKLIGHLRGHLISKDHHCDICGKNYPNPSTFRVHLRTHTGERPFRCQICDRGFVRWAGVVNHMKTHTDTKPHKCDLCGKRFKIVSNLERHKVLHSSSLPYCCNYCGKTFSQSDNLKLHIRTYHTNDRPYLCNECGKNFVSQARLKRHMHSHTGYKPHMCMYCTKSYRNLADRLEHEYRCHASNLIRDRRLSAKHQCSMCARRFVHPSRLTRHMRLHQNHTNYSCSQCTLSFTSQRLLNRHLTNQHSKAQADVVEEVVIEYLE